MPKKMVESIKTEFEVSNDFVNLLFDHGHSTGVLGGNSNDAKFWIDQFGCDKKSYLLSSDSTGFLSVKRR